MVAATNDRIPPGVQLICYGPFYPPKGAQSMHKLLPSVNMKIVHHMIMFGGSNSMSGSARAHSDACYRGGIVYAWARTGQTSPIGLDFDESATGTGDAYAVGPGTSVQWFALQIHYQQLSSSSSVLDNSGIKMWFRPSPPVRPLEVELMMSAQVRAGAAAAPLISPRPPAQLCAGSHCTL
mgnify:CR=1 FL=1